MSATAVNPVKSLTAPASIANFGFAILIGLSIGATELISRYRDEPFAPLLSIPGAFYIAINGGAAALAYYFLQLSMPNLAEPMATLTAGVSAMAFFRSSLFTVKIGDRDTPVGPSLILMTVLKALDRAYDRTRAEPRSLAVQEIMGSLSFEQVYNALPVLCCDLMQTLATEEISTINTQANLLKANKDMSDHSKSLSLGLALLNLVGEKTLKAAVNTLGTNAKAFRAVDDTILIALAKIEPAKVVDRLPAICHALYTSDPRTAKNTPPQFEYSDDLPDENKALLLAYQLVNYYGDQLVLTGTKILG